MIDHSNKENYSTNHNIIIPKPISTWKRSQSNIDRKDFKNIVGISDINLKNGKTNQIIKIKKGKVGSLNDNLLKIEEAFQQHQNVRQGIQFSYADSNLYATEQKQNSSQQPDSTHNYKSTPSSQKDIKQYQSTPSSNLLESEMSSNILTNLNQKLTQIQNVNITVRRDIQIQPSNSQSNLSTKPTQNQLMNADLNFNRNKNISPNSLHINIPSTVTTTRQKPTFFENNNQQTQFKPYSSKDNLLKQEDIQPKGNNIQIFENQNDVTDESGIKKHPNQVVNRNYQNEQINNVLNYQSNTSNNMSNTNTFNFTNNNINNNNNNLSAFFEQSTVCFNNTENEESNNLIRVFDKHMQDKQDLFKVQLETSELLGETNYNKVSKKLNAENTLLFDEKVFIGNMNIYQEAEYVIFKNSDFNRLLLKQEAIQELLVQQQMKIKGLENQFNQQNGIERFEQKEQMLQQMKQDLESYDRIGRFNSRGSDYSQKQGSFNCTDTDFRQFNQKSFLNNGNADGPLSMNRVLPTEKDDDCKSINNITDILNMQTDESHSQFDISIHARKSSNISKYHSNPIESNYQTNIPRLSFQNNDCFKNKTYQSNMLSTFGQSKPSQFGQNQDNQFLKKQPSCSYSTQNLFQKKIQETQEEQPFFNAPENLSQLKSSVADQSRIMDENEEGEIRQSIKETCRNRIIQGQIQEVNHNCFIDGVETFRGNQPTISSLQNNQNTRVQDSNQQQSQKPPKIPCGKKIFSERSNNISNQSNISTFADKNGNIQSNFASTDRSHNNTTSLRSKSSLGLRVQANPTQNNTQNEELRQNSEQQNSSYSTLPSNNTHHFRSHGEFDNNSSLNRQGSQQNIKLQSQDQNCNIF